MHHHGSIITTIINRILSPFNTNYSTQNEVLNNKNVLSNNYNKQYLHYMKRYPMNPKKVRFTQEEIDGYFPNTVTIVQNYIDKNEIQGWIFD